MSKGLDPILCSFASVILFALACASVSPPTTEISAAEAAIRQAEGLGAVELAPLPMRIARDKLDEAKALVQKDKSDHMSRARRLAEEAAVEARLAEETARTAALENARDEAQQTIESMRREVGLDAK